ncbi:hypothetical protein MLD38_027761 [Melastoma candidum]|uniref:Uncharacterized protein n=1 Tax=Melastoma candidum TaxID=119954 RepID=A0ACB9P3Z7_9MYRT|nr:hypothetical protein MLD38_027761 [Melastoma candidum]
MPFHCLTRHSLPLPLLFFASFLVLVAAQPTTLPSSLPPPPQASSSNTTPTTTLLIALVSIALFFLVFFTVCILRCVGVPINPTGMSPHCIAAPKGLGADVLRSFPTFVYSGVKEHKVGKGALECAICISEFKDYEMLRLLPKCDHVFHIECIDEWVSGHVTCPVCRSDLVPPSGDSSVKGGAADSVQEARDHVEVESREPNLPMDVSMRGRGKEGEVAEVLNWERARETCLRKKWWCQLGRSHSTGHLLVRPGDDTERFTLRLPDGVRKQIIERPMTPYFFTCEDVSLGMYKTGEASVGILF